MGLSPSVKGASSLTSLVYSFSSIPTSVLQQELENEQKAHAATRHESNLHDSVNTAKSTADAAANTMAGTTAANTQENGETMAVGTPATATTDPPAVPVSPKKKEPSYWLMNHMPVVIAGAFKNQINSVHTSSTLFVIDSLSTIRGN